VVCGSKLFRLVGFTSELKQSRAPHKGVDEVSTAFIIGKV